MTTSVIIILWLIINGVGVIAASWLTHISRERKINTIKEENPITPKAPRIRNANRQIRDRLLRAICQLVFVLVGILEALDIRLPYAGTSWLFMAVALYLTTTSVIDLWGEINN